jgi:hypothetical protein
LDLLAQAGRALDLAARGLVLARIRFTPL